jgi:hypothetical protein
MQFMVGMTAMGPFVMFKNIMSGMEFAGKKFQPGGELQDSVLVEFTAEGKIKKWETHGSKFVDESVAWMKSIMSI